MRVLTMYQLLVLWRLTMMSQEEDLDPGPLMSRREEQLQLIEELAKQKAISIFGDVTTDTVQGVIRPRKGVLRCLRGRAMLLWRIEGLDRDLWLGVDGIIYYRYDSFIGEEYWMVAEIEERTDEGLQRVINALS